MECSLWVSLTSRFLPAGESLVETSSSSPDCPTADSSPSSTRAHNEALPSTTTDAPPTAAGASSPTAPATPDSPGSGDGQPGPPSCSNASPSSDQVCEGLKVAIKREKEPEDDCEGSRESPEEPAGVNRDSERLNRIRIKDMVDQDSGSVFDGGGDTEATPHKRIKSESDEESGSVPTSVSSSDACRLAVADSKDPAGRPWSVLNGHPPIHRPEIICSNGSAQHPLLQHGQVKSLNVSGKSPPQVASRSGSPDQTAAGSADRRLGQRVPSVILGESGGVKTMVWTGHWADQSAHPAAIPPSRPRSLPTTGHASVQPDSNGHRKTVGRMDNDPAIRLSVDGLLSLAAQQGSPERIRPSSSSSSPSSLVMVSQSSPPQGSPSSSTVSPTERIVERIVERIADRPSVLSRGSSRSPMTHFTTPLRVQTPTTCSSSGSSSGGLLTTADRLASGRNYPFPESYSNNLVQAGSSGHHAGLPPSISRPAPQQRVPAAGVITSMAPPVQHPQQPLSMERLWEAERSNAAQQAKRPESAALDYSLNAPAGSVAATPTTNGHAARIGHQTALTNGNGVSVDEEEDDTPMICMICEDKATGLHYGIITCEG